MNIKIRLIAILLAMVTLLSLLVGCNSAPSGNEATEGKGNENKTEATQAFEGSEIATEEEFKPDVEEKNYGKEFYLAIMGDVNAPDYHWVKESSNNALTDAVYKRQELVRDHIGVEIIGTVTENESRYIEPFKNAVKNKDGSVDLLISHVYYGIDGFITGNYLTDFKDIPEINLDAPYWRYSVMEGIAAKDHFYLGFSDFNIFYTHVIAYNKELLSRYEDQLDEDIYSTVENYRWTLDKFMWLASLVHIDETADGKTDDDTYGFAGKMYRNIGYAGFIQACNIQLVDQDDSGNYVSSIYLEKNKEKMANIVDKFYNFVRSDSVLMPNKAPSPSVANGRALMQTLSTYSLSDLLQYDVEFGVLPYPMYDENQKDVGYRHLQWGGYLCMPSYLADATMAAETVELLSYYSDDVNIAFYEKMLGKQVADVPQDRRMLDIVWDGICYEMGQTYYSLIKDKNNYLYTLEILTEENTTTNLASYVATTQGSINKKLKKFFASVK